MGYGITDYMALLCNKESRRVVEQIFSSEERQIDRRSALAHIQFDRLAALILAGVVYEEDGVLSLNDHLQFFFESISPGGTDADRLDYREAFIEIEQDIGFFNSCRQSGGQCRRYLKSIAGRLRRVHGNIESVVAGIHQRVELVYKEISVSTEKYAEIKSYLERIQSMRATLDFIHQRLAAITAFAYDTQGARSVLYQFRRLDRYLAAADSTLSTLSATVIEYMHKVDQKNRFRKHLARLKESRDRLTLTSETNIGALLYDTTRVPLLRGWVIGRGLNRPFRLPLEYINTEAFEAQVLRLFGRRSAARPSASEKEVILRRGKTEAVEQIDYSTMFEAFVFSAGPDDALFPFLQRVLLNHGAEALLETYIELVVAHIKHISPGSDTFLIGPHRCLTVRRRDIFMRTGGEDDI